MSKMKPLMFRDESAAERFRQAKKISDLKNLGPETEKQFAKAGIKTVQQFQKLGWQGAIRKLVKSNSKHLHSMYAYALIGALQNIEFNMISDKDKKAAREFCAALREKQKAKK